MQVSLEEKKGVEDFLHNYNFQHTFECDSSDENSLFEVLSHVAETLWGQMSRAGTQSLESAETLTPAHLVLAVPDLNKEGKRSETKQGNCCILL